jgi:hypothetical protein
MGWTIRKVTGGKSGGGGGISAKENKRKKRKANKNNFMSQKIPTQGNGKKICAS